MCVYVCVAKIKLKQLRNTRCRASALLLVAEWIGVVGIRVDRVAVFARGRVVRFFRCGRRQRSQRHRAKTIYVLRGGPDGVKSVMNGGRGKRGGNAEERKDTVGEKGEGRRRNPDRMRENGRCRSIAGGLHLASGQDARRARPVVLSNSWKIANCVI